MSILNYKVIMHSFTTSSYTSYSVSPPPPPSPSSSSSALYFVNVALRCCCCCYCFCSYTFGQSTGSVDLLLIPTLVVHNSHHGLQSSEAFLSLSSVHNSFLYPLFQNTEQITNLQHDFKKSSKKRKYIYVCLTLFLWCYLVLQDS